MAKQSKSKNHPHKSKPYEGKIAERATAKRAMRGGTPQWTRPEPPTAQHSRIDQPSEQIPD